MECDQYLRLVVLLVSKSDSYFYLLSTTIVAIKFDILL